MPASPADIHHTIAQGKTLPRPRAILFDWDNTLADTWPIIHAALHATFTAMGREPWSLEEVQAGRDGIHHSLRDSFPRIFGENWPKAREIYYQHFLENHLTMIQKLPGADAIIETLADTNIYLGVVSNKTGIHLRKEVAHLGWEPHFHKVVGATDAESDKPSAAPVHLVLEGSGITPGQDVWLIGDSETDYQCAQNAGIRAIIYNNPALSTRLCGERPGLDLHHVSDHDALLKIVRGFL